MFIGFYLFPMYVGQELFIDYLSDLSGDYWTGVYMAAVLAGLVILAGLFLIKPQLFLMLRNPYAVGAFAALLIVAYVMFRGVF